MAKQCPTCWDEHTLETTTGEIPCPNCGPTFTALHEIVSLVADSRVSVSKIDSGPALHVLFRIFDDHDELQGQIKDAAKVLGVKLFWGRGTRLRDSVQQFVRIT